MVTIKVNLEVEGLEEMQKQLLLAQQKLNEFKQTIDDFNKLNIDVKITHREEE